ncbi:MAG: DUF3857 domain-containing protein [Candidatus Cloacimonetes bacterium]|nr:DUF3857 domain-containing protein [Candidatus Cloacimonadota bacterium]
MKKQILSILVITLVFPIFAFATLNNDTINSYWNNNQFNDLEKYLLSEKKNNPTSAKINENLILLYNLFERNDEANKLLLESLNILENPQSYLRANYIEDYIMLKIQKNNPDEIEKLFNSVIQKGDPEGIIDVISKEFLSLRNFAVRKFSKSEQNVNNLGGIKNWKLIGPFENISASGFSKVYPPEGEFDLLKKITGKNNIQTFWFDNTPPRYYSWINHKDYFPFSQSIFYANTFIKSPIKQKIQFRFGNSGAFKIFLNDELLMENEEESNNGPDTFIIETELQEKWNRILIKNANSEISNNNFLLRITNEKGELIHGLEISTDLRRYSSKPNAIKKILKSSTETFYENEIEANPDYLENYIYLSNYYYSIDKMEEAIILLKKLIDKYPDNALLNYYLARYYQKNQDYDEWETISNKIEEMDLDIPIFILQKIVKYTESGELDKVKTYLDKYEKIVGKTVQYYANLIGYYAQKELSKKMVETIETAYSIYPNSDEIVAFKLILELRLKKDVKKGIKIYKKYLKTHNSADGINMYAQLLLQISEGGKWEKQMLLLQKYFPTKSVYFANFSNDLVDQGKPERAYNYIKTAIKMAPMNSAYWEILGKTENLLNNRKKAIEAYKKAIHYNPWNYSARDVIRELEKKEPIFSVFEEFEIDSLAANSPGIEDFPEDDAIILLDTHKYIIYPEGGSQYEEEFLVKLLNKAGIQTFTNYSISLNSYKQSYTIEEALTIKPDGRKITADTNRNQVVFKTLEENDVIYIRWKIKNYENGRMLNHFWDTVNFNYYYPVEKKYYSMLVPDDKNFEYIYQNLELNPEIKKLEEGKLYTWSIQNEPSIKEEVRMPSLNEIGKIMYVSSIPDWQYIIDWYQDLATSKIKANYEIKNIVKELLEDKDDITEDEKIKLVYDYITENITYSSVSFRQSAYTPQKARDVLVNKIGDCKDVSALSVSMLREMGIEADLTLVNTGFHKTDANLLPAINHFDHCITTINTENGIKYLDHTAHNYPMNSIPLGDIDAFSLKITKNSNPEYLHKNNFEKSGTVRETRVILKDDDSAEISKKSKKFGRASANIRYSYRELDEIDRNKTLKETLTREYTDVVLHDFELNNLDIINDSVSYSYNFDAKKYLNNSGNFKFCKLSWTDDLTSSSGLSYETRNYPYLLWSSGYDYFLEDIEISLPSNYVPLEIPENIIYETNYGKYEFNIKFKSGKIFAKRYLEVYNYDVAPEEYLDFKEFFNNIVKADETQLLLKKK